MENSLILDLIHCDNDNNIKINNFCKTYNIRNESITYLDMKKALEKMNETLSICDNKYIKFIGSHINYNNKLIIMNLFCF